MSALHIAIGGRLFAARLQSDLAPQSCKRLTAMLPFRGDVIHARWSGEAIWSPPSTVWPNASTLEREHATGHPKPGEVLVFVDYQRSEPELLIPYGATRFASKAGPLEGNPVLLIEEDLPQLVECGREILMHGAMELRIGRPFRECLSVAAHR
jgi:Protein of unknown function (DUF3830)